jgi:ribose transport system substrate-binding protein
MGLDVLIRHHENDAVRLIQNVDEILAAGVSLLLCYNPDEHASHVIADRCSQAGVPVLAITFPVPGARLFGINNYRAGLVGGEGLGDEVRRRWDSRLDFVVVLDIPGNSPAQQARITGMIEGLRGKVGVNDESIVRVHIDRRKKTAISLVRELLEARPRARRIAILSYNDMNALDALRAVEEVKRSQHVLILSQGGVTEVRQELRRPGSPIWGAVAHFPERFGSKLVGLMRRILRGENVPATVYTEHVLLTRANVDAYYGR